MTEILCLIVDSILSALVLRQKLVAKQCKENSSCNQNRQTHFGILEKSKCFPHVFHRRLGDEVARRSDERKVSSHSRRKYKRHQKS